MTLPPRMLRAWRATLFTLDGGAVLRVGRRSAAVDAVLARFGARQGVILTAWNPFGRRHPEGWNRRLAARLAQASRRFPSVRADGALGRWAEEGLLLAGDPRRAVPLARRFRQGGVVLLRRGARARLVLLASRRVAASSPPGGSIAHHAATHPPSMDSAAPFTAPDPGPHR